MAVLPMRQLHICGLKKNRKQILELLQRRGVVEIRNLAPKEGNFEKIDTSSAQAQFEKAAANGAKALAVLNEYVPVKGSMLAMLQGRKAVSIEDYDAFVEKRDNILEAVYDLNAQAKKIAENRAEILKLKTQLDALEPWMSLDIPMTFTGTKSTAAFIGVLPGDCTQEALYAKLAELAPEIPVTMEIISRSPEQTCIFLIAPNGQAEATENALRILGFLRPPASCSLPPSERKKELEAELAEAAQVIDEAKQSIQNLGSLREDICFLIDYYTMRAEKYDMISRLMQSRWTFFLAGYVPQRCAAALEEELSHKFDLAIAVEEPSEEDDVPVLLKNNKFTEPVESVVASYSLPGKREIDPTAIMSVFYYVLFGMMLSDAGYGVLMVIACGVILLKFKNMEVAMRKNIRMFFFCGVSTIFWGFMFGSFFGDAVGVIASTFFHSDVTLPPIWFEPVKDPMRMLVFSFLIGILHLFTGLGIQFYQLCKQRKYKDAIYDVVFWYLLVGGGIVFLLSMEMVSNMLGLGFRLPGIVGYIAAGCAGLGALGILLTSGRESRSPVKRLLKGMYGLYNMTGYLSDILSYSRLLALGLATGVIATVFNKMGSMMGGGVLGAIVFILVFLVGHLLNIAINLLGAYVHTNRLQFVEFFGKFYEGGGRKFEPFAEHTKYYKIREDK